MEYVIYMFISATATWLLGLWASTTNARKTSADKSILSLFVGNFARILTIWAGLLTALFFVLAVLIFV